MADVAEFCMIRSHRLEDDAMGPVNSEAPYFVMLRVQLLHMERRMKRIGLEQVGLGCCFALNGFGELVEEAVERGGCRDIDHGLFVDQLAQRLPFCHPAGTMVLR